MFAPNVTAPAPLATVIPAVPAPPMVSVLPSGFKVTACVSLTVIPRTLMFAPRAMAPWLVALLDENVTVAVGPGVCGVAPPLWLVAQLLLALPSDTAHTPGLPLRPPSQNSLVNAVTGVIPTVTDVAVDASDDGLTVKFVAL